MRNVVFLTLVIFTFQFAQWVETTILLPDSLTGLVNPGAMVYNPGSNALFVGGENGFVLIDGLSNRKVGRTVTTGYIRPRAAVYASLVNRIYWCDEYNYKIFVLDGYTGRLINQVYLYQPIQICYNQTVNRVYVISGWDYGDRINIIDCFTDRLVKAISLGSDAWVFEMCSAPAVNKVYLTVLNDGNARVGVVDSNPDSIIKYIAPDFYGWYKLMYNYLTNRLYIYSSDNDSIAVVDCAQDSIIKYLTLPVPYRCVLNPSRNKFYFAGSDGNINILCGYGETLITRINLGRRPSSLLVDSFNNRVWAGFYGDTLIGIDGAGDTICAIRWLGFSPAIFAHNAFRRRFYGIGNNRSLLYVFNLGSGWIEEQVCLNFTPYALCRIKGYNKIYCAGLREAAVAVVNNQNRVIKIIPVDPEPIALESDRQLGKIYCISRLGSVDVITASDDSVKNKITIGGTPVVAGIDTLRHKLWLGVLRPSGLAVINLRTEDLDTLLSVPVAGAIVVDLSRGRVYCAESNQVAVIDADNDSVVTRILTGGTLTSICPVPNTDMLVCGIRENLSLALIDLNERRLVEYLPLSFAPEHLFYHRGLNKLYCAGSNRVAVFDWASRVVVDSFITTGGILAFAYDSIAERLYLLNQNNSVDVIDCRRDTLIRRIDVGSEPKAIVFAPEWRRMYVANSNSASITVIKDSVRVGIAEEVAFLDLPGAPTIVNGAIILKPEVWGDEPGMLIDVTGRAIKKLLPGVNSTHGLGKGVYFIRVQNIHRQIIGRVIVTK